MVIYKRIIPAILLCLLLFCGCNPWSYLDWSKQSEDKAYIILEYFVSGNFNNLKEQFCMVTLSTESDLDVQINSAMQFFNGHNLEINNVIVGGRTSTSLGQYDYINPYIHAYFNDKETNINYDMYINLYLINVDFPDKEGISQIKIKKSTEDWDSENVIKIGDYVD
jgi:hypothetical protein